MIAALKGYLFEYVGIPLRPTCKFNYANMTHNSTILKFCDAYNATNSSVSIELLQFTISVHRVLLLSQAVPFSPMLALKTALRICFHMQMCGRDSEEYD